MGMYPTPYDTFGMLSYQAWRASRLVVDTGVHHLGWTRKQAQDYLRENTALSDHEIETEVDRYISWPGQALSYYIGEAVILARASQGGGGAGGQDSTSAPSTTPCSRWAPCPSPCWRRGSIGSSPRTAADPIPTRSRERGRGPGVRTRRRVLAQTAALAAGAAGVWWLRATGSPSPLPRPIFNRRGLDSLPGRSPAGGGGPRVWA